MFDWIRRHAVPTTRSTSLSTAVSPLGPAGGEYQRLHEYLRDRYANRLVLTFAEIEDLLGFPLPDSAWHQDAWWSDAVRPRSAQSKAWTLVGRTATVNLMARCVAFERDAA